MTARTDRRHPLGRRPLARAAAVLAAAGIAVLALALPAEAHVTVSPTTATEGGYTAFTFRVPNEETKANTTKVEIALPTDTPLASVSVKPVPGWSVTTTEGKLPKPVTTDDGPVTEAVTRITWTATSTATTILPGQFQEFEISGGPLPESDKLVFKALQTYSDGSVVRWIEEQAPGADEPQHPAPTVTLAKASSPGDAPATEAAASTSSKDSSNNGVAIGLGIAGLVVGLIGLAAGLLALRRSGARTAE
jgi:uncharacterized protein YcnI